MHISDNTGFFNTSGVITSFYNTIGEMPGYKDYRKSCALGIETDRPRMVIKFMYELYIMMRQIMHSIDKNYFEA